MVLAKNRFRRGCDLVFLSFAFSNAIVGHEHLLVLIGWPVVVVIVSWYLTSTGNSRLSTMTADTGIRLRRLGFPSDRVHFLCAKTTSA